MFLAKTSINKPIATTMGIMVFLIFGLIAFLGLNLNQMPDVEIPFVTIQTIYPGAGPKEIETLITKRIEDVVSTVSEIKRIESYSLDGASIVMIEFRLSKDVNVANQEVKDKVDLILNDLPDDAQKPTIQKFDFGAMPIISLVLSGDRDPRDLFQFADKTLKDRFGQIAGVANVDITGGQEREIRVVLDNKVIYENYISLPQMLGILKAQNMNIPGGYFQIEDQEYTVRLQGEFNDLEKFKSLQIPTAFGNKKLEQIADVIDSGKDIRRRAVYFNATNQLRDENVVRLDIIKATDGNVVKVAEAVQKVLPEIEKVLPEGTRLEVVDDKSTFIRSTVDDTMSNIFLGVILTSMILLIFLTNIRSTFIVAMSMPVSIISTFLLLQMAGLTLNTMTLMGISVSVGVLVANSVVVIENIFRHKKLGRNNREAAYKGTVEVTVAVVASTLTNLVVFLPIANMSSMVGLFLRELALAASFATIFSLIFSFTLTPMLASLILPDTQKESKFSQRMQKMYESWDEFYRRILSIALKNKFVSLGIIVFSFALFIASSMYYGPKLGFEFMPQADDGKIKIEVELPEGYNLTETASVLEEIENRVKKHPEVVFTLTDLGSISNLSTGANMARMDVKLVDSKERDISVFDMISTLVNELSDVANARVAVDVASSMGGGGAPIQFFLVGQELDVLENMKDQIIGAIQDVPGLINLDQSSRAGKPEITVYPNREKLADAGLTTQELALTLRSTIEGIESSKYRELGEEYDIIVTVKDEAVNTPEEIGPIPIVSQRGVFRLAQLADIKFTNGYTKILHRDKFTAIQFTGASAPGIPIGNVTDEIDRRVQEIEMPTGYGIRWAGNIEMMKEMNADFGFAFILAIILTYMLLAAILESFLQPFFILLTLPLAMIGVFASLYYTGISLGITSMMAIIMLIGIVVNNAILMLDFTNQLIRDEGMNAKDALIEACPTKLKPIIMSTLAIMLGMLPMALGIGDAGAEMRMPLGVVSIGGLIVSAVLTLFVIPAFYYLTSSNKTKTKKEQVV